MARPNLDFTHRPTRGSDVENWIKSARDRRERGTPWYSVLDRMLDDYRLRADHGLDLDANLRELVDEAGW
jgi:hypothetical protein